MRWVILCGALSGLFGSALVAGERHQKVKPVVVLAGRDSECGKEEFVRCETESEWEAVWRKHQGDKKDPNMPEVDFDSHLVVAIFHGDASQNHGLFVIEVIEEVEVRRLRFRPGWYQILGIPDSESARLELKTRSYAFVVLPKSRKTIIVEEDVHRRIGDPPMWEDRAKLRPKK